MSKFQVGSIIFFIAIAILALLMFSGIIPTPGRNQNRTPTDVKLVIWGTLPQGQMQSAFADIRKSVGNNITVSYVEKDPKNLKVDLLSAWSRDESPDLVLFPAESLLQINETLRPLTEAQVSERTIKDSFIEGGDVFVSPDGVMGLPFLVDPLVLYWNRDLFNKDRVITPPTTWDDVLNLTRVLTKTDGKGTILQSAIALGESHNVDHVKDIMSLFFLQVGDGIIKRSAATHDPVISFGGNDIEKGLRTPAVTALSFYTSFANVRSAYYSWNGSFDSSLDSFVKGTTALYLGPASDQHIIAGKNPHLNFDVAPVPQLANTTSVTFGNLYALGLPKGGKNPQAAFAFAWAMTISNDDLANTIVNSISLPPARRSLLAKGSTNPILSVFYKEAVIAKGWLDPNPEETTALFSRMINDTLSEAVNATESITSARTQLNTLLKSVGQGDS